MAPLFPFSSSSKPSKPAKRHKSSHNKAPTRSSKPSTAAKPPIQTDSLGRPLKVPTNPLQPAPFTGGDMPSLVHSVKALQGMPRSDEALRTLWKLASACAPIMRNHGFMITNFCEFYPKLDGLLGLNTNHGWKIEVRLRYATDKSQFQPWEMILDTFLHELCHNRFGPHDANFHALWDQLRDEHNALTLRGFTGEAMLGRGRQLGGSTLLPTREQERIARKAITSGTGGGKLAIKEKLGGSAFGGGMRDKILAAIDNRLKISSGCATVHATPSQLAELEAAANQPMLSLEFPDLDPVELQAQQALWEEIKRDMPLGRSGARARDTEGGVSTSISSPNNDNHSAEVDDDGWETYDFNNLDGHVAVDDNGWETYDFEKLKGHGTAENPIAIDDEDEYGEQWTCSQCTCINAAIMPICEACGLPRASAPATAGFASNPRVARPAMVARTREPEEPPGTGRDKGKGRADPIPSPISPLPPTPIRSPSAIHPTTTTTITTTLPRRPSTATPVSKPGSHKIVSLSSSSQRILEAAAEKEKAAKDKTWTCEKCTNIMESQWWTCSVCGAMKGSS